MTRLLESPEPLQRFTLNSLLQVQLAQDKPHEELERSIRSLFGFYKPQFRNSLFALFPMYWTCRGEMAQDPRTQGLQVIRRWQEVWTSGKGSTNPVRESFPIKFLASRENSVIQVIHYNPRNSLSPRNFETSCFLWTEVFHRCR